MTINAMLRGKTIQDVIFRKTEGDRWFARNREALLRRKGRDWPLALLARHKIKPARVLEVGSSFGWRLEEIRKQYGARCVGIEPSSKAIDFGRKLYPGITFRRGLMHALPVERGGNFDLVIAAFVFHWVDRSLLLRSAAELDRALTEGGYLIITDFLPNRPVKRPYHHLPDRKVFTYKQDYAKLFTASGLYREEARVIFHHGTLKRGRHIPHDERAACVLLKKEPQYKSP